MWQNDAKCFGMDTDFFYDKYEEDSDLAACIDELCQGCPVRRECFSHGINNKEWGVWGGVYLKEGSIDYREYNQHKKNWFDTWSSLTMEVNKQ
jgi:hypothetical protein